MPGDSSDAEDRPLTRREARAGERGTHAPTDPASPGGRAPVDDTTAEPGRGGDAGTPVPVIPADARRPPATPLTDAAFPGFDATSVPPRPPLPGDRHRGGEATGVAEHHTPIREHWRATRDELAHEFESHVTHAREQFDQANERIKQRTGRDLLVAIGIGVGIGAVLLASLLFFKQVFIPIALAIALLGTFELSRALRAGGRRVDVVPQLLGGAAVVLTGYFAELWTSWVVLFASVAFVAVWRMIAQMVARDGRTYGDVLADVTVGAFVQVYVPFLTSIALMLLARDQGEWWVLSLVTIAAAADTCAYAAGLAFGRHPMAPRISPKKTWEGFGGAVVGSLTAGVLFAAFALHLEWWTGLILGAAILVSATLGDLGESMIKRDLGIKDMSSWIPGHGGVLDRLDSILPSTVPAFALSFLLSPWMVP